MNAYTNQHRDKGFTIVEVIVTTVVVSIFIISFFELYLVSESQRVELLRQSKASDIAYTNLQKYPTLPANLSCSSTMDLIANANAQGQMIGDSSVASNVAPNSVYSFQPETDIVPLSPSTTRQKVIAYAPHGCTGSSFNDNAVKILSTVTYGNNRSVSHANILQ